MSSNLKSDQVRISESPALPETPPVLAPRATYRLQFSELFRLPDARALAPYLQELGISHAYASPLLQARPHSTHGYDGCDFHRLNPELGTEADLLELVAALRSRGIQLILDIVPNHMGIGTPENRWWWDVLKHGRNSRYADYFDIDWEPPDPRLRDKVIAPILGDRYPRVLARGELRVGESGGKFLLRYFDQVFPLAPDSLVALKDGIEPVNADQDALDALVQRQHYYLTNWRRGGSELNYRRFFDITTLAALRVEDERVFNDSHELVRQWMEAGLISGLRVDHPDGLRDPAQYFARLRALAPQAWIVAEKILQPGESSPESWPVQGTTGYDFLNRVNGLFIDPAGESPLTGLYARFTGESVDYQAIVREKKLSTLRIQLSAEVNRLASLLVRIAGRHRPWIDFTRTELCDAMCETAASLQVYRTYARPVPGELGARDRVWIDQSIRQASAGRPELDPALFEGLRELLTLSWQGEAEAEFVWRFQQLTGATMAKGVEDTAFYCFNRLVSLNEVGGQPDQFGLMPADFHESCIRARQECPDSLLATATHDTKRGEDMRARLNLLSEIPVPWGEAVQRWSNLNERFRRGGFPDRNAEYLLYQTLVGAWPVSVDRACACMEKSAREAKSHTDWTLPNPAYDDALRGFITGALENADFVADLERFVAPLIDPGFVNSLAQTLVKLTAPGVPDIYQGAERWDFNLVDPDNRRPVDFGLSGRLLSEAGFLCVDEIWRRRIEGLPKLWLISRVLNARRLRPECFSRSGTYAPLPALGDRADHVVAFVRGGGVVTLVPRLVMAMKSDWRDTAITLPDGQWSNALTGENVTGGRPLIAPLLARFPVAFLLRASI